MIKIGDSAEISKQVTNEDILNFANITGDHNPIHLDEEYAKQTIFGGKIAHGLLISSYISSILGTKLPGEGCVYISQELKFKAPVKPSDIVVTKVEVIAIDQIKNRATLSTKCFVGDKLVIDGTAIMLLPKEVK